METTVLEESYTVSLNIISISIHFYHFKLKLLSQLPDGRVIKLSGEQFSAPEVLFQPQLIGVEGPGLSELIFDTIQAEDIDCRMDYYKHIVLSGGSTMCRGLTSRLECEITNLYLTHVLKGDAERLSVSCVCSLIRIVIGLLYAYIIGPIPIIRAYRRPKPCMHGAVYIPVESL